MPLDAPVLPSSGEDLRRVDGDQAYVESGGKMVGEIPAAGRRVANNRSVLEPERVDGVGELALPRTRSRGQI